MLDPAQAQKLIEESPSPALDDATREMIEDGVAGACRAISYLNAGTSSYCSLDGAYYFIELNARLQVEVVSALVTGMDMVREPLKIAAGERCTKPDGRRDVGTRSRFDSTRRIPPAGFAPAPE